MTTSLKLLFAVSLVTLAPTGHAQMLGHSLEAEWLFPNMNTVFEAHTTVVSTGIELTNATIIHEDSYSIDIRPDSIRIEFSFPHTFANVGFNGWRFRDVSDTLRPITDFDFIAFGNVGQIGSVETGFNDNEFWMDLGNVTAGTNGYLIFRLEFGEGQSFCDFPSVNSTGLGTQLFGRADSLAGSGLHLDVWNGPPGEFGYFLVGDQANDPGVQVGGGLVCIDMSGSLSLGAYNLAGGSLNSIGRFDAAGVLVNLAGTSTTGFGFDLPNALPFPGSPVIQAGETWHFQVWHRDGQSPSGLSQWSNGLSVSL